MIGERTVRRVSSSFFVVQRALSLSAVLPRLLLPRALREPLALSLGFAFAKRGRRLSRRHRASERADAFDAWSAWSASFALLFSFLEKEKERRFFGFKGRLLKPCPRSLRDFCVRVPGVNRRETPTRSKVSKHGAGHKKFSKLFCGGNSLREMLLHYRRVLSDSALLRVSLALRGRRETRNEPFFSRVSPLRREAQENEKSKGGVSSRGD